MPAPPHPPSLPPSSLPSSRVSVFCLHVCLCTHALPSSQKRGQTPETEVTDVCEPLCGLWDLNPGPLQEQPGVLTTEPLLQPQWKCFSVLNSDSVSLFLLLSLPLSPFVWWATVTSDKKSAPESQQLLSFHIQQFQGRLNLIFRVSMKGSSPFLAASFNLGTQ